MRTSKLLQRLREVSWRVCKAQPKIGILHICAHLHKECLTIGAAGQKVTYLLCSYRLRVHIGRNMFNLRQTYAGLSGGGTTLLACTYKSCKGKMGRRHRQTNNNRIRRCHIGKELPHVKRKIFEVLALRSISWGWRRSYIWRQVNASPRLEVLQRDRIK